MTTYLGKSCSFGLPRVPFVNCGQFMYLVISLLVLRAGCGICLYQFLIIAYLFTLQWESRNTIEKEHNSAIKRWTEQQTIRVLLFFILIPHIKFQDPISNRSWERPRRSGKRACPAILGRWFDPPLLQSFR